MRSFMWYNKRASFFAVFLPSGKPLKAPIVLYPERE